MTEVRALDGSGAFDQCEPLFALRDQDQESVVAAYLRSGDSGHVVGYEESRGGWHSLTTIDGAESASGLDALADEMLEWATDKYDAERLVFLQADRSSESEVSELLPARPVGKSEVMELTAVPGIERVHPMFCFADSHEIIAILVMEADPETGDLRLFNLGFDDESGEWKLIESNLLGEDDPDPSELTIHDWIFQRYDEDSILAISPDEEI